MDASAAPPKRAVSLDTRVDEVDQVVLQQEAKTAQQQQQQQPASSSKRPLAPPPSARRPAAPPPPPAKTPASLLPRLAAAVALSSFVGALYVSTSLLTLSLTLLATSWLTSPLGWLLLALLALLATLPLGAATPWGLGVPLDSHAALTAPVQGLGLRFVHYVTAAAGWYFPVRVIVEGEGEEQEQQPAGGGAGAANPAAATPATTLSADGAYMVALEPHSVLPLAIPAVFSTDSVLCPSALRGKVHGLASSVCFNAPIIRHLWWVLGIRPVTRKCIARLLTGRDDGNGVVGGSGGEGRRRRQQQQQAPADAAGGGLRSRRQAPTPAAADAQQPLQQQPQPPSCGERRSVVIVPGGVQECLYMQPPEAAVETAYLSNRRGFVRLAMRCGADAIVPVFSFGQSHGFTFTRPGPPVFSEAFVHRLARSMGAVPMAIWGRWGTPAPHRRPMVVVVGRPLPLPRPEEWGGGGGGGGGGAEPPAALVQQHLDGYIAALKELVETHKVAAGFPETTLRVM
jgi:hypothetical protein